MEFIGLTNKTKLLCLVQQGDTLLMTQLGNWGVITSSSAMCYPTRFCICSELETNMILFFSLSEDMDQGAKTWECKLFLSLLCLGTELQKSFFPFSIFGATGLVYLIS